MSRGVAERVADVRRLLAAAREVYAGRAAIAGDIAAATGLSLEGVELGFASLEKDATDAELGALVAAAGDAEHVHVVLSANVFVAPLRAMALARAAAERVTVRPSPRDPVLARALVAAAGDPGLALVEERDVAAIDAGQVHVYGRDATIAAVRARVRPGVVVRGHGAGLGVAVVSAAGAIAEAAEAIALDVAAFDQRGCLSPRVVLVVGGEARAEVFAGALHEALARLERRVPRGALSEEERGEVARWMDLAAFAGRVLVGEAHAVAALTSLEPQAVPPSGRHVVVVPMGEVAGVRAAMASVARYVVAVGTDEASVAVPSHARVSRLGGMQRPALDGPVDRR